MAVDPLMLLELDHRQVETMLEDLEKSEPGPERKRLVQQLASAFEAHAHFEERVVYPIVVDAMDVLQGAEAIGIEGRSSMTKEQAAEALVR